MASAACLPFSSATTPTCSASQVTLSLYLKTVYYALIVWAITLVVGFTVSYFLVFHVRSILWQMALFLLVHGAVLDLEHHPHDLVDPVPGPQRLFNQALMALGVTKEPLEFLLFSDFAVIIAYVHLFTLFMIVPIFNSMARIDRSVIEAAAGRRQQRLAHHLGDRRSAVEDRDRARLDLRDHAGDGRLLRGEHDERRPQRLGGPRPCMNQIAAVQYPLAAASAVILLLIIVLMVAAILRLVDVRRELAG